MRSLFLSMVSLALTAVSTACGPIAAQIATSALYPYDHANQIEVPERAAEGYQATKLTENDATTSVWFHENPNRADAPVVIFFHGNGENIAGLAKMGALAKFATLDVHVVVFDYPKYGLSTGELNQRSVVASGNTTFQWAKARFAHSPMVIWGRSLGSAVAIQVALANQADVKKLLLSQPWDTLKHLIEDKFSSLVGLIPDSWFEANEYNSVAAAGQITVPTLIHHGENDKTIPISMGQNLAKGFPPGVSDFRPVPGKDHNDLFTAESVWEDAAKFIGH